MYYRQKLAKQSPEDSNDNNDSRRHKYKEKLPRGDIHQTISLVIHSSCLTATLINGKQESSCFCIVLKIGYSGLKRELRNAFFIKSTQVHNTWLFKWISLNTTQMTFAVTLKPMEYVQCCDAHT